MRYHHLIALTATALAAMPAASASACSVPGDYRVPTNLELVEGAELVMLGRVVGEKQTGEEEWDRAIVVQPLSAIKGTLPTGEVLIQDKSLADGELEGYGLFSNPYELEAAHPATYIGGCIRYVFPRDTTALFFLERENGEWRSSGDAFSRWAEDVLTADAPWLRLTKFYTEVAAAPANERRAMLEAERDRLALLESDPIARLMAQDVARQLQGPNEPWNAMMARAIEDDADIDPAMAVEAAAAAAAGLVIEAAEAAEEREVTFSEDGDSVTATATLKPDEVEAEGQAEAMEDVE